MAPEGLIMHFGGPSGDGADGRGGERRQDPKHAPTGNYLLYRGGVVRLGRMTMTDADLRIADSDPPTRSTSVLPSMLRQLAAGYVKVRLDGGLEITVPDYDRVGSADLRPDLP